MHIDDCNYCTLRERMQGNVSLSICSRRENLECEKVVECVSGDRLVRFHTEICFHMKTTILQPPTTGVLAFIYFFLPSSPLLLPDYHLTLLCIEFLVAAYELHCNLLEAKLQPRFFTLTISLSLLKP